ncbi:polysaccharide biosynthesis protein GumK [Sphingobium sp. SCG-1]|uniref:GumK N-terminal domain-containing glycosyltransferase n=1 Tax=Sphingobium sp. SCG-1 TaxID=2072936 RepID=UPI000CD69E66|nr:polysaccharide biosynthesis protein GumK [Sphingobium sp. SCG-1]AUW58811.1 polysaccharide biosynthesis protein GumK [Sphingobium sp. SCG-1]
MKTAAAHSRVHPVDNEENGSFSEAGVSRQEGDIARSGTRVLILSRHDYRTKRKASAHFLAKALAEQGHEVRFFSVGYSWLSRLRGDSRTFLDQSANHWESVDGVYAYLWRGNWHATRVPLLGDKSGYLFDLWARSRCDALDEAASVSDVIIVESGIAPMLIPRVRAAAPHAKLVYRAADLLSTAGVHPRVQQVLEQSREEIDLVVVVARAMLPHFDNFDVPKIVLRHGIDRDQIGAPTENPYERPRNIVSAGSMLFDPNAVCIAAEHMPDWHFHLIGVPVHSFPDNVVQHPEMPFASTLPYLRHADIGLAAYQKEAASGYLAESSLKLLQFGAIGLPAVCPQFAVEPGSLRFGYDPERPETIVGALERAALAPRVASDVPSWSQVAKNLIEAACA